MKRSLLFVSVFSLLFVLRISVLGFADESPMYIDDNGMFRTSDGSVFIVRGFATNHVFYPREGNPQMRDGWIESAWNHATDRALTEWLKFLSENGVNTLRVGLTVWWDGTPGDQGGYADEQVMDALERYLSVADTLGMKVIPVFWWGHYGLFGFRNDAYDTYLFSKDELSWFTHQKAVELQKQFITDVVTRFKDDPRILAWELMNEIRSMFDPMFTDWTNELTNHLRDLGIRNLVKIDHLPETNFTLVSHYNRVTDVDIIGYRGYPVGGLVTDMGTYYSAQAKYATVMSKVAIMGEFGTQRASARRIATRDAIWMSLVSGAPGIIGWDGDLCPAGEFRIPAEIWDDINWEQFERSTPPVVISVKGTGADLRHVMVYDMVLQEQGYDYDVIIGEVAPVLADRYELTLATTSSMISIDKARRQLAEYDIKIKPIFSVSDGYVGSYLLDSDSDLMVFYGRNYAGVDEERFRIQGMSDFELTIDLQGEFTFELYDLDMREVVDEGEFTNRLELSKAATAHDYAVYIKRVM